jgi:hypothetical protein
LSAQYDDIKFNHITINDGLSNNIVRAIAQDSAGFMWFGTENGLNRYDGYTFKVYKHDPESPLSLSQNHVEVIHVDKSGIIWIGTYGGGLNRFDPKTEQFTHYKHDPSDSNSISADVIYSILEDKFGFLWHGTIGDGLLKLDQETYQFKQFIHNPDDPYTISSDKVRSLHESIYDGKYVIWIGTEGGLNRFDYETEKFTHYTHKDGLPSDEINGILDDKDSNLWLSTGHGISKFNPESNRVRNYDVHDGLQSNQFIVGSYLKSSKGEMFFGGMNGFNTFYPEKLLDNPIIPKIVFTDFQIFNKSVSVAEKINGQSILPKHISMLKEIELSHDQSVFSFEFAALDFRSPVKNKYAYIMEGIDPDWVYTDASRRFATYTHLDHGEYIFRVKGSNNDGIWNEEGKSIKIIILPPWWKTNWAYISYFMLFIGLLIVLRRYDLKRQKLKQQLEMEHFEADKLREVDKLKSRFFANISHEFRTPLTLIKGPVKQVLSGEFTGNMKEQFRMILSNSDRLLSLINQLLDLSKLESGRMKLKVTETDLIPFLKGLVFSFSSLADRKNIALKFKAENDSFHGYIDRDKIEKIITNLLANAFKFTPEGGMIIIDCGMWMADSKILNPKS